MPTMSTQIDTIVRNAPARGTASDTLRLALPKGRMQEGVFALMAEAGLRVRVGARGYRPRIEGSAEVYEAKILKPQNVVEMLAAGTRDAGFAGADWVCELSADLVEVLDTGLDRVRMVAAAPPAALDETGGLRAGTRVVVASEYERITREWMARRGLNGLGGAPANNGAGGFVRSYGATEAFPPEDATCIVDITASGETLRAQNLTVFEDLMESSTRLYASRRAWENHESRAAIERLAMLLRSVLEARERVMLEVNVSQTCLMGVVDAMPCMREPTVSPLHAGAGFAVKAAVPRAELARLIPEIRSRGGTDIVVTQPSQIVA